MSNRAGCRTFPGRRPGAGDGGAGLATPGFAVPRPAFLVLVLLITVNPAARAQSDTAFLTLHECIRLAQTNGPLGVVARRAYETKQHAYDSFSATFLPQLTLQGDLPGYYRSINSIILPDGTSIFAAQSQASSSLNLALSQKIPFTGADLSFVSGLNRIDLLESRLRYYRSNPLTVYLRQPLFQINTMRWDRKAESLRYRIAGREAAEAMEQIAIDVTNRFFDFYLASMSAADAALNLANNDTLYRISKGRYNVGRIAENDLLQSELAYFDARTQLENAQLEFNRSAAALRTALGLDPSRVVAALPPTDIPELKIDSAFALAQARLHRSEALQFDLLRLNAERAVSQARSDNLFNATMTASVGFNQQAPAIPEAYRNLLDQQQFTLRLDVPIFRWGAGSSAIDAAISEQRRVDASLDRQRQEFDQETEYQVSRLNLLRNQVAVAEKADTIAQRRFDVSKERYLIGKIDIPNLFLAQSEKDIARRRRIQTLRDYWSAFFQVRRLTLYDFTAGESLIEEE